MLRECQQRPHFNGRHIRYVGLWCGLDVNARGIAAIPVGLTLWVLGVERLCAANFNDNVASLAGVDIGSPGQSISKRRQLYLEATESVSRVVVTGLFINTLRSVFFWIAIVLMPLPITLKITKRILIGDIVSKLAFIIIVCRSPPETAPPSHQP